MERISHIVSGLPGVRLIDAEYRDFAFPRHFHLEYHVGLLLNGRQRFVCRGESRLAGRGDALLMAPEQIHDGASQGGRAITSACWPSSRNGWMKPAACSATVARGTPPDQRDPARPPLQARLQAVHAGFLGNSRLALESVLWPALACLLGQGSTLRVSELAQGFDARTWQRLREWLESRLESPPSLEELAAFCGLSPWQALRRFRQHCGLPPHQWLTQLRLERARRWCCVASNRSATWPCSWASTTRRTSPGCSAAPTACRRHACARWVEGRPLLAIAPSSLAVTVIAEGAGLPENPRQFPTSRHRHVPDDLLRPCQRLPSATYAKLFQALGPDFRIRHLDQHGHDPRFPVNDNWENLVDELIHHLEAHGEPVFGVGHSLGGVLHYHAGCAARTSTAAWRCSTRRC